MSSTSIEKQFNQLAASIKAKRETLDAEARRLRAPEVIGAFDKWNHTCWCLSVTGDTLVRLRLFTEQNFDLVETIGVLSATRYIFELSVWLYLLSLDPRYGLVYYAQLIDTQHRYWKDYRQQLKREVDLLRTFEQDEQAMLCEAMRELKQLSSLEQQQQAAVALPQRVAELIDKKATRHFSLYAEQAKVAGYGYQAHLVEQNRIREIDNSLAVLEAEKRTFKETVSEPAQELIPKRWNWREMAKKVELLDEYDFIYTVSSKLLHATPASITTDHKTLDLSEIVMFLKYISVKIDYIIELAKRHQGINGDAPQ